VTEPEASYLHRLNHDQLVLKQGEREHLLLDSAREKGKYRNIFDQIAGTHGWEARSNTWAQLLILEAVSMNKLQLNLEI
jgi:hypothetical protein